MDDHSPDKPWCVWVYRLLLGVFILSFIGSTIAIWADVRVQESDAWTRTVAPLANDPAIQQFVVDRTMNLIDQQFAADQDAGRLETFTRNQSIGLVRGYLEDFVNSPTFASWWEAANRNAHEIAMRRSNPQEGDILMHQEGVIALDLQPVIDYANAQLQDALPLIGNRSVIQLENSTIILYSSEGLANITRVVRKIDYWSTTLPIVAIASLAAALLVSPNRQLALAHMGIGVAIGVGITLATLSVWQSWFVSQRALADQAALNALLHTVLLDIVRIMRLWAFAGLILGGIIFASQSSYARHPKVQGFLRQHRQTIALSIVAIAILSLIVVDYPSAWISIPALLAIIAGSVLVVIWRRDTDVSGSVS